MLQMESEFEKILFWFAQNNILRGLHLMELFGYWLLLCRSGCSLVNYIKRSMFEVFNKNVVPFIFGHQTHHLFNKPNVIALFVHA